MKVKKKEINEIDIKKLTNYNDEFIFSLFMEYDIEVLAEIYYSTYKPQTFNYGLRG